MNKKLFCAVVALMIGSVNIIKSKVDIFPGSIYFPKNLSFVPHLCIYQSGEQLPIEIDDKGSRVCFSIQSERYISTFHLIITNKYHSTSLVDNTVKELVIPTNATYKYYKLTFNRAPKKNFYDFIAGNNNTKKKSSFWTIEEKILPENKKIPDKAIIVLYNAQYVEKVISKKSFEFPTIIIKPNLVNLIGSKEKIENNAIELLLSSLDYNTMHTKEKKITHINNDKTIVSLKV